MKNPVLVLYVFVAAMAAAAALAGAPPEKTAPAGCHGVVQDVDFPAVAECDDGCDDCVPQVPASVGGCHGEKDAGGGCHGKKASIAQRRADRTQARADRREAARTSREEARASRAEARSCRGSKKAPAGCHGSAG